MSVLTDTYTLRHGTSEPGITIPKVGFGTWQIPNGATAYQAVADALRIGYRHIDTAFAYGNEESVGKAVHDSGLRREDVFITSKLPADIKQAAQAQQYFNESLKRLGTDYIDLYLSHAPWPWSQIGTRHDDGNVAVWQVFERLLHEGRVHAIGVSNFDVPDLQNLLDRTTIVPAVDQIQYYVGFTEPKISTFAQQHGILIEAYSPLATGRILDNDALREIAGRYEVSVPQLALRFVLQRGVLPLPKATSQDHIRANAQLDFTISEADMASLGAFDDAAARASHNPTQG